MKRNYFLFLLSLLFIALSLSTPSKVFAQYGKYQQYRTPSPMTREQINEVNSRHPEIHFQGWNMPIFIAACVFLIGVIILSGRKKTGTPGESSETEEKR